MMGDVWLQHGLADAGDAVRAGQGLCGPAELSTQDAARVDNPTWEQFRAELEKLKRPKGMHQPLQLQWPPCRKA